MYRTPKELRTVTGVGREGVFKAKLACFREAKNSHVTHGIAVPLQDIRVAFPECIDMLKG
jgi:hypothetical protein